MKYGSQPLFNSEEIVAIGDIHGEVHKLEGLLPQVTPFLENPKCHMVFCGDYFNRGINTPRTFEVLAELKKKYPDQVFFIRGNHEDMFNSVFEGKRTWLKFVGPSLEHMVTYWDIEKNDLKSISLMCLKKGFIDFLDDLIPYYESENVICTHAGLDPIVCQMNGLGNPIDDLVEGVTENLILDKMLYELKWSFVSEDPKLSRIKGMEKFLICGHQYQHHGSPRLFKHRAFIDTGCGGHRMNPITALHYPSKKYFQYKD